MSTQHSSQGHSLSIEANQLQLSQQGQQWRDIGISAVAAAASQASDKRTKDAKSAAGEAHPIVTIRDIEHLAA